MGGTAPHKNAIVAVQWVLGSGFQVSVSGTRFSFFGIRILGAHHEVEVEDREGISLVPGARKSG